VKEATGEIFYVERDEVMLSAYPPEGQDLKDEEFRARHKGKEIHLVHAFDHTGYWLLVGPKVVK